MSNDYILLNEHDYPNGLAIKGHQLIYALMSNTPGSPSRPYYVGQAKNLTRFIEHTGITWHIRKTSNNPHIWIAGIVPRAEATAAEQDLITRLSAHGYKLLNRDIRNDQALKFQSAYSLGTMSESQITRYFQSDFPPSTCLIDWKKNWNGVLEAAAPAVVDPLTALFTNTDGIDVRTHPSYFVAAPNISSDELVLRILKQDALLYAKESKGGTMLKMLAMTLAGGYDCNTGHVNMSTVEIQRGSGMSKATVSRSTGPLCQTGLWGYLAGEGRTNSRFYPLFVDGVAERYLALTMQPSISLAA